MLERPVKLSFTERAKNHLFKSRTKSRSSPTDSPRQEENRMGTAPAVEPAIHQSLSVQIPIPEEFRCPISGEIMSDPVIVASGQSYERSCMQAWFDQGRSDCYKSKAALEHKFLIPNVALKTAIQNFSELYKLPQPEPVSSSRARVLVKSILEGENAEEEPLKEAPATVSPLRYVHSASGATLRTEFNELSPGISRVPHELVTNPSSLASEDSKIPPESPQESAIDSKLVKDLVQRLNSKQEQKSAAASVRELARQGTSNRQALSEPEVFEALVGLLQSPFQECVENSVAALLNLSLETENKLRIVRAGAAPHLIHALRAGSSQVQELAAGVIFSLALHEDNRLALGVLGAIPPLIEVLKNSKQHPRAQQDASMALYHLSLAQLNRSKMVKAGLVPILLNMAEEQSEISSPTQEQSEKGRGLASRGMSILSCLAASSDGRTALLEINGVQRLFGILKKVKNGEDHELKEHTVATLVQLSHYNIRFRHLAMEAGGIEILCSVFDGTTVRGREKIGMLLNILKESTVGSTSSTSFEPYFPRQFIRRGANGHQTGMKAESSHF